MSIENENITNEFGQDEMKLSVYALSNFRIAAGWAKFLAILGFIMVGLIVIGAIWVLAMAGSVSRSPFIGDAGMPMTLLAVLYLVMAVILFFPAFYMLKFANKFQEAAVLKNVIAFEEASNYTRLYYRYVGVMTIIVLAMYFFALIAFVGASV